MKSSRIPKLRTVNLRIEGQLRYNLRHLKKTSKCLSGARIANEVQDPQMHSVLHWTQSRIWYLIVYYAQNAKKYNKLKINTLMSPVRKPPTQKLHLELTISKIKMAANRKTDDFLKKRTCLNSGRIRSTTLSAVRTPVTSIHLTRLKTDVKTTSPCTTNTRIPKSQMLEVTTRSCSTWWRRSGCCSGVTLRMAPQANPAWSQITILQSTSAKQEFRITIRSTITTFNLKSLSKYTYWINLSGRILRKDMDAMSLFSSENMKISINVCLQDFRKAQLTQVSTFKLKITMSLHLTYYRI